MATVFSDYKGVLFIDYLQKGKTFNSEYYCNLLDLLDANIRENRSVLKKKRMVFHQDHTHKYFDDGKIQRIKIRIA